MERRIIEMIERYNVLIGEYDCYAVSNYGNVKNLRSDYILKSGKDMYGYPTVLLSKIGKKKRVRVHDLVANSILPKVEGKNYVNHKDGIKHNNHIDNLEWCTQKENMQHAVKTGLIKTEYYNKNVLVKTTDGEFVGVFNSVKECCDMLGLNTSPVYGVLKGKRNKHHSMTFQYVNRI